MVNFAPPTLVEGATRAPLPYGLFSVLTPRPEGDAKWRNGVQWESLTCGPASGIGEPECEPGDNGETVATGLPKTFANGVPVGEASALTVYGSFECSPAGFTVDEAQAKATAHLLAREEARVERALWTGDLDNTPNFVTDVTVVTGGAAAPALALALLEEFIADTYGSVGVIHASRAAASVLASGYLIEPVGNRLLTRLGTPVVAGAGYPGSDADGDAAATGESWLRATPALFGFRSEIDPASNRAGDNFDRAENNMRAIAERTYLIGFDDCGVGAARMTLTCC